MDTPSYLQLWQSMIILLFQALGQLGRIVQIDSDGDIMVKVKNRTWTFNPVACNPVEDPAVSDKIPDLSKSELIEDMDESQILRRDIDGEYYSKVCQEQYIS